MALKDGHFLGGTKRWGTGGVQSRLLPAAVHFLCSPMGTCGPCHPARSWAGSNQRKTALEALELALATRDLGPHPSGFLAFVHGALSAVSSAWLTPRPRPEPARPAPPVPATAGPAAPVCFPLQPRVSLPLNLAWRGSSLHAGVFHPGCLARVCWVDSANL